MGAQEFYCRAKGRTATEAFQAARDQAYYDYGHRGYTGSLAEKSTFAEIKVPDGKSPLEYARELMENDDGRICDKWGPAGAIKIDKETWLFFGWASS